MGLLDLAVNAEELLYQPTFLEWAVLQTQPFVYQQCDKTWQGVLSVTYIKNSKEEVLQLHVEHDDSHSPYLMRGGSYLDYCNERIVDKFAEHLYYAVWSHTVREKPLDKRLVYFGEHAGGRGVYTGMPSDLFEDEEEDDDWWDKWDCFLPYPVDVECTPRSKEEAE